MRTADTFYSATESRSIDTFIRVGHYFISLSEYTEAQSMKQLKSEEIVKLILWREHDSQ